MSAEGTRALRVGDFYGAVKTNFGGHERSDHRRPLAVWERSRSLLAGREVKAKEGKLGLCLLVAWFCPKVAQRVSKPH